MELLAVVTILGILAAMILPRVTFSAATAKANVNSQNIAEINSAVERYYLDTGGFAATIAELETVDYFPEGIPVNPVTGDPYTLDPNTHRVVVPDGGGK